MTVTVKDVITKSPVQAGGAKNPPTQSVNVSLEVFGRISSSSIS